MPFKDPEKRRAYERARVRDVTEYSRLYMRAWREANYERNQENQKAWLKANKDYVLAARRAWYKAHKAEAKVKRETYREKERALGRVWYKTNKEKVQIKNATRRARVYGAPSGPISPAQLRARAAKFGGGCFYCSCRGTIGPLEHWDHGLPLSRGGSHTLDNLFPSCAACNLSKGAKTVIEFLSIVTR